MAVTHSTAARNAATDAVTALIGASGSLVFRISPSTVSAPGTAAATLPLSATAFAAASSGTAILGGRVAMLGFLAAVVGEGLTGQGIVGQLALLLRWLLG